MVFTTERKQIDEFCSSCGQRLKKQTTSDLMKFDGATIQRNFYMYMSPVDLRLWWRCRKCKKRFPSNVNPKKLKEHLYKHYPSIPRLIELKKKFIVDKRCVPAKNRRSEK